jgi:hypothetical protein
MLFILPSFGKCLISFIAYKMKNGTLMTISSLLGHICTIELEINRKKKLDQD